MDNFYENKKEIARRQQNKQRAINNEAASALKSKIKTSIMTSVIGALADFEDQFGEYWGHGRTIGELSTEQKAMRHRWNTIRDSILSRCEKAIKICSGEVNKCEFKNVQNRYSIEFKRRDDDISR